MNAKGVIRMSREPITIDAWATYVSPEGAKKWPPEFLHIFNKYRCPPSMTEGQPLEAMLAEICQFETLCQHELTRRNER